MKNDLLDAWKMYLSMYTYVCTFNVFSLFLMLKLKLPHPGNIFFLLLTDHETYLKTTLVISTRWWWTPRWLPFYLVLHIRFFFSKSDFSR